MVVQLNITVATKLGRAVLAPYVILFHKHALAYVGILRMLRVADVGIGPRIGHNGACPGGPKAHILLKATSTSR